MRALRETEVPLVSWLLESAGRKDSVDSLYVETMADGGMGSMQFPPLDKGRKYGETVAEALFEDRDGTPVVASLNVDTRGELYEIDIWRVDFGPLQRWPDRESIAKPPSNIQFDTDASRRST